MHHGWDPKAQKESDPKGKMRCLFSPLLIFTPLLFRNPEPEEWGEVAGSNCCVSKTSRLHVAAIYGLGGKMMGLSQKSRQPSRLRAPLRRPQPKHFMGWGSQVTNCQNRAQVTPCTREETEQTAEPEFRGRTAQRTLLMAKLPLKSNRPLPPKSFWFLQVELKVKWAWVLKDQCTCGIRLF